MPDAGGSLSPPDLSEPNEAMEKLGNGIGTGHQISPLEHVEHVEHVEYVSFFHSVGNLIIPIDELIFFRGVGQPPTRSIDYPYIIRRLSIYYP